MTLESEKVDEKRIGIIGGGAIGLLFMAYFTRAGYTATLFVRREAQRQSITDEGLLLHGKETIKLTPQVHVLNGSLSRLDLLIIAVKQPQLSHSLLQHITESGSHTVLFIQNGMAHVDKLSSLSNPSILFGVVEHGATKISDREVAHKGFGSTKIAPFRGNGDAIKNLKLGAEFPFAFQTDWKPMLLEKLLINHSINPLTALYRVQNGELVRNRYFFETMKALYQEGERVFYPRKNPQLWDKIVAICQTTKENRSSMFQDIESGRETEIAAISGYVLKEADRQGITLPLTNFIVKSIMGLQSLGEGKKDG